METNAGFSNSQLFVTDARLVLALLNHLRYQMLRSTLGLSREQANVLTVVALLIALDGAYESTRRITGMRPHLAGSDVALGAIAMREASLSLAGPGVRAIPGLGALVAFALLGGFAAPALRRAVQRVRTGQQRLRAAEQRLRGERIKRYVDARDRAKASAT